MGHHVFISSCLVSLLLSGLALSNERKNVRAVHSFRYTSHNSKKEIERECLTGTDTERQRYKREEEG